MANKTSKKAADYAGVAKREKTWATEAAKDAKYNDKAAKRERKAHKLALAKDSAGEAKLDREFAVMRRQLAAAAKRKADKLKSKSKST